VGPANFTRPKHKRTVTGFGPSEIKSVEASIPEPQREAWRKFVSAARRSPSSLHCGVALGFCVGLSADSGTDAEALHHARGV
jgi:hypothetical protein